MTADIFMAVGCVIGLAGYCDSELAYGYKIWFKGSCRAHSRLEFSVKSIYYITFFYVQLTAWGHPWMYISLAYLSDKSPSLLLTAPHCSSFHQVLRLLVRTYNILYVLCITFMKYVKPSGKIAQINPLHITIVSLRNRTLLRALCGRLVGVTFVFNNKNSLICFDRLHAKSNNQFNPSMCMSIGLPLIDLMNIDGLN